MLRDVTFTCQLGVTFLVGRNGAGKTTLLKLLAGDLRLPSGALVSPPARIAYLPQSPQLCLTMQSHEFVAYCGWLQGLSSRQAKVAAHQALLRVGLIESAKTPTRELSGGMQRRLAIAAVTASPSDVLLLDEPMAGLDPQQRSEMRQLLAELGRTKVVIVSSHVMQDVTGLSDRILMLDNGVLTFNGSAAEFLGDTTMQKPTLEVLEAKFIERLGRGGQ